MVLLLLTGGACTHSGKRSDSIQYEAPWKMAILAYTFRNHTFFDAVDKASALGIRYIGGYPGQPIGGGVEGTMSPTMDEDQRRKVLDYLASKYVKLMDFGVISPESEQEWTALFDFAKAMGVENIVSEPNPQYLDRVSALCDRYQINVVIHNHASPSTYWNPDTLMSLIEGKSERMGVCADVGHWVRSGLDPVMGLQTVRGRLMQLHFKDVSLAGPDAEDVVWGTGVSKVEAMLAELVDQGFSGFLSVEYERNPADNMQEIRESLQFYEDALARVTEKK
ncbi:hypothetical protein GCM10007415_34920 [Parapedobacter pyrenivorans]|uniref:Xylose isomerase-like TIM barrel domain-containing protein n=2 Tax=Parapedobacter pyrenivorans TaxID=1305674 RepID=A0A917HXW3_9SPHI|nr:hypothetical protein GCM10007415_34920 [Parapedobacter pyrenivorans]